MKKTVLFVINNMHIGGTRTSVLNLLSNLKDDGRIDAELLILSHRGILMSVLPAGVTVIPQDRVLEAVFCKKEEIRSLLELAIRIVVKTLKAVLGYEKVYGWVYKRRISKMNLKKYDVAVGYQEGETGDFAMCINANMHLLWIHNNYENIIRSKGYYYNRSTFQNMDRIVFVAEKSKESFLSFFPQYKNKCIVIKNTLNKQFLRVFAKKDNPFAFKDAKIKLVSIGRFSSDQKGFDRLPEIGNKLRAAGIDYDWIVIGDGPLWHDSLEQIKRSGLAESIHLVGASSNPYSTVVTADLFVLTSRYESQPMVILEALYLGVPVISTHFDSAIELLGNEEYAVICDNSSEGISEAIKNVFFNNCIDDMKKSLVRFNYDNATIINDLLEVCSDNDT